MRIKRKNFARLASISALGAGALGVAGGTAEAGTITYHPIGVTIGPDGSKSYIGSLLGAPAFALLRSTMNSAQLGTWMVGIAGSQLRESAGGYLRIVGAGQKWNTVGGPFGGTAFIAKRGFMRVPHTVEGSFTTVLSHGGIPTINMVKFHVTYTTSFHVNGNGSFTDGYALFTFQNSGKTLYGWLELSNSVSTTSGPDVTLVGVAYDSSGNPIAAGDTGTPEPSTMALTGLAALALGAAGLRRWRGARKPAA
jgi:hypothetical protein